MTMTSKLSNKIKNVSEKTLNTSILGKQHFTIFHNAASRIPRDGTQDHWTTMVVVLSSIHTNTKKSTTLNGKFKSINTFP